ncbi:putative PEP-binding protein [Amycolatopsis sp., V23-08]|uniref:PEP-binding protein n=1 Tax=Amycolatopsis heterodermiae TaxID=3110235 RepID=A0ABU5RAI8_9PSEU|nr:putative PEP-binding protein [Amycolatopsis sp., V23-08]MEA5362620.1 putative PEP-binding protein [Amycolatopsis sp., V23-08]
MTDEPAPAGAGTPATLRTRTLAMPDLPFTAVAHRGEPPETGTETLLLVERSLSFGAVRVALEDARVAGIVVGDPYVPDHARKMLREGGKALVRCDEDLSAVVDGARYQVDEHGLIDLGRLPVPVSAICSYFTDDTERLYQRWNVRDVGYFRLKFCLFRLYAEEPSAYAKPDLIADQLTGELERLARRGWRRVRLVLSDPTTSELRELGIDVPREANPELGARGPREAQRWWPELQAIDALLRAHPELEVEVSIPFVSSIAEYELVADMVRTEGLTGRIRLGFTLEVPAMVYALPELMARCRPAFVAVGTSDLFAFVNAIDRSHSTLKVDPFSAVNRQVVTQIATAAAELGVPFFFCGELRHSPAALREFVARGCTELIAGPSAIELARMVRASAERKQDGERVP